MTTSIKVLDNLGLVLRETETDQLPTTLMVSLGGALGLVSNVLAEFPHGMEVTVRVYDLSGTLIRSKSLLPGANYGSLTVGISDILELGLDSAEVEVRHPVQPIPEILAFGEEQPVQGSDAGGQAVADQPVAPVPPPPPPSGGSEDG